MNALIPGYATSKAHIVALRIEAGVTPIVAGVTTTHATARAQVAGGSIRRGRAIGERAAG